MASGSAMTDIRSFGAAGDGTTDDTAAIQKAIDAAAETQATLYVPQGVFLTSTLRLRPHVGLTGSPTFSYRSAGGSVLRLCDAGARCLLDLTGALGATINGLCLDGAKLGADVHGIMVDKADYGRTEDTPRIERCLVAGFSGDGVHLNRIWCYNIRGCMVYQNAGCAVWVRGWDGFVLDNWLSGNGGAGFGAYEENASVTLTGNRIEWNRAGGLVVCGGTHYNVTGNYIDRSGGPGMWFRPRGGVESTVIAAVGNIIYGSGKPDWPLEDDLASAQARFDRVKGLTFSGNALNVSADGPGSAGNWSRRYGIVYAGMRNSVISGNAMHCGATERLLVDLGGHGEGLIVKDNPGSLFVPGQTPMEDVNAVCVHRAAGAKY